MAKRSNAQSERLYFWIFVVPGLVYIILLRLLPSLYTLILSFFSWNLIEDPAPIYAGMHNYIKAFSDASFLSSIWRTIVFTVCVTTLEFILGLVIALLFDRDFAFKNIARSTILIPMIITPSIVGVIWYILYNTTTGPINYFLGFLGINSIKWVASKDTALLSVIIMDIWHWTPFMFLLLLSALQVIPRQLYEAAIVDGASIWQLFWHVTLPLIKETAIVAIILRSLEAFRIFAEVYVMTGGGPANSTETMSMHIYKAAFNFFEMGYAGTMVVISLIMVMSLYAIYMRYIKF